MSYPPKVAKVIRTAMLVVGVLTAIGVLYGLFSSILPE